MYVWGGGGGGVNSIILAPNFHPRFKCYKQYKIIVSNQRCLQNNYYQYYASLLGTVKEYN